jgi:hypothetical protein
MPHRPTPIEKGVSDLLISKGILKPQDLTIEKLSKAFHVQVLEDFQDFAFNNGQVKLISLDEQDPKERKYKFLTLISHTQLHKGNHLEITKEEFDRQVEEAFQFSCYLAIPFHMLGYIKPSNCKDDCVNDIANMFQVPKEIVLERHRQIEQRLALEKQAIVNTSSHRKWFA